MKDYYSILNLPRKTSIDEVKKAYRKLALLYHPDKNHTSEANEKFLLINEAYQILSDQKTKAKYDLLLIYGIEEEIKVEKKQEDYIHPKYHEDGGRKYGTAYKYKNFNAQYRQQKKQNEQNEEKELSSKLFEKILFVSLMVIGVVAIVFSVIDLFTNEIEDLNSFNGLLFGLLFTSLLFYCYFYIFNKKI